jgi:hypothetical protein
MFISNQTLKDVPRVIRTLVKCVVFSRCTNDIEIACILDEYAGNFIGGRDMMMQVWNDATKTKYNFLMINMADESNVRIFKLVLKASTNTKGLVHHYNLIITQPQHQ